MPASNLSSRTIGFYGGGMMAEAIVRALLTKKVVIPSQLWVCDPVEVRRDMFQKLGLNVTDDGKAMLTCCTVIFLAIKPDIVPVILPNFTAHEEGIGASEDRLLISICAGVTIGALQIGNAERSCARVMPNQPCLVGEAASAFTLSKGCTEEHREIVKALMGACGVIYELPEKLINAVTGLSGSGPAYVYMMIEAMSDGGVRQGLPRSVARQLAAQTVYGSAKMALEYPDVHPGELRNRVESPGGTTIVATARLEDHGFRYAVIDAIAEATKKAKELGEPDNQK